MLRPNGILIQNLDEKYDFFSHVPNRAFVNYEGLLGYDNIPLSKHTSDIESRCLNEEFFDWLWKPDVDGGLELNAEIFYSVSFFRRYYKKCNSLRINTRVLFIESDLNIQEWPFGTPEKTFMGYEYCSNGFDIQLISDLFYYKIFEEHRRKCNSYGLFDSYDDCLAFKKAYEQAVQMKLIKCEHTETGIYRLSIIDDPASL